MHPATADVVIALECASCQFQRAYDQQMHDDTVLAAMTTNHVAAALRSVVAQDPECARRENVGLIVHNISRRISKPYQAWAQFDDEHDHMADEVRALRHELDVMRRLLQQEAAAL